MKESFLFFMYTTDYKKDIEDIEGCDVFITQITYYVS